MLLFPVHMGSSPYFLSDTSNIYFTYSRCKLYDKQTYLKTVIPTVEKKPSYEAQAFQGRTPIFVFCFLQHLCSKANE